MRTNDASMEMMAVRIMTQSLFPGFFRGVRILYVSSDYRDIVFLGNAPIPKYKAPWHRPLYWRLMETKGLKKVPRPAQFEDALFILALIWPRSRVRHWARMNRDVRKG
jgi:hypothetical protein